MLIDLVRISCLNSVMLIDLVRSSCLNFVVLINSCPDRMKIGTSTLTSAL